MNLIFVLILAVIIWVVMSYLKTFERLSDEVREMRLKCISANPSVKIESDDTANSKPSSNVIKLLEKLKVLA